MKQNTMTRTYAKLDAYLGSEPWGYSACRRYFYTRGYLSPMIGTSQVRRDYVAVQRVSYKSGTSNGVAYGKVVRFYATRI